MAGKSDRIGKPRINQIANASDARADCKVLREIGRKPLALSSIRRFRGLYPVLRAHGRASRVSIRGLPGQWKTSHSRGNVNSSRRALPPYSLLRFVRERERVSAKDSRREFNGQFLRSKHSKIVNHGRFQVSCADL